MHTYGMLQGQQVLRSDGREAMENWHRYNAQSILRSIVGDYLPTAEEAKDIIHWHAPVRTGAFSYARKQGRRNELGILRFVYQHLHGPSRQA